MCTYVLGGDWNVFPGEAACRAADFGWHVVLPRVETTAGGCAFDNFLVNCDACGGVQPCFVLQSKVLKLTVPKNLHGGQQGLSDHDPIVLKLVEVRRRQTPKALVAELARSAGEQSEADDVDTTGEPLLN